MIVALFGIQSVRSQVKVDTQPIKEALKVLPKDFKIPEDAIRYTSIDNDFPNATAEWKKEVSSKLAFVSPGEPYVFVNVAAVNPATGRTGEDPYSAAIQWRKYGMPVSPATYIIAAILAHEYYGHGAGCTEATDVCQNELRALNIERDVYAAFMDNSSKFDAVNQRAGFDPKQNLDQLDSLIKRYSDASAVAVR